jgi:hypothetical protein
MSKTQAAAQPLKDLYELGELPPLGHVPANMYAWTIRRERHGPPQESLPGRGRADLGDRRGGGAACS